MTLKYKNIEIFPLTRILDLSRAYIFYSLVVCFLLSINYSFGQEKKYLPEKITSNNYDKGSSDTLRISKTNENLIINSNWRSILKDDPSFKSPTFNDNSWPVSNIGIRYSEFKELKTDSIGWYRKKLIVDSVSCGIPLIFSLKTAGAWELYIDGQLIETFGKVSGKDSKALFSNKAHKISYVFKNSGEHTIALRFFHDVSGKTNHDFDPNLLNFKIDVADSTFLNEKYSGFEIEMFGIITGLFLLASFIHLFFYFNFQNKYPEDFNLYFSISLLLFATFSFFSSDLLVSYDFDGYVFKESIQSLIFIGAHFLLLIAVAKYLQLHKKALFVSVILTILLVAFVTNFYVAKEYVFYFDFAGVMLLLATYVYIFIISRRQNRKLSGTLLKALKIFGITFFLLILLMVGLFFFSTIVKFDIDLGIQPVFLLLMIIVMSGPQLAVSFAIISDLAKEFVRTNKNLLLKISEVEELSLEKENLLKKQNIMLEEKVATRTIELKKSIENLKSTQAQLIQSEKLASLGELTAGIAHEIQNPLNFVNNFAELSVELIEELKSPLTPDGGIGEGKKIDMEILEDVVMNLEKINFHGKRASSIVKGMLEHSRANTGEKEPVDINALADEYLRLSYHGLRAKDKSFNADFKTEFDEKIPKINGVVQDIGRVFLNLINNAFYACNERAKEASKINETFKPLVIVKTTMIDNNIEISVHDNGSGISEENITKIFQPFFTTKPTGKGTGLGLSLSYDIVTKGHNGSLKVDNNIGIGTTFRVILPIS